MEQNPVREQLAPRRALNFQSLDAWRGLACLFVVLFHCRVEMRLHLQTLPHAFEWARFGYLGVQFFFVISGFCIAVAAHSSWHKRNFGGFVWARFSRIFPPLWAALLLVMALKVVAGHSGAENAIMGAPENEGPLFYAANFSLLNPLLNQPYLLRVAWSLCCEITFYALVFGALLLFSRARSPHRMLDALHALSLGILAWLLASLFWKIPAPAFPLNYWPQFGAGILVFDLLLAGAQKDTARQRFLAVIGLTFATLGVAFLMSCQLSPDLSVHDNIAPFAVAFGFAILLWSTYRFEDRVNRWRFVKFFSSIGTFSYSIYLVHFTLIMALSRGVFSHVKRLPWFVEVALLVLSSVGSGWIFYRLVEKPSHKLKRVAK